MRYSKALIPTLKEVPAEAEVPSHQLMIRAGLMRKLASGTYTYLPAGWKCLQKVMAIVREEMNAAGAQEILMPAVQPLELWQQTGRDVDYGPTMAKFEDRHGRQNVLAPTAEEVVTSVAAGEIKSYKQLPMNIYQISFKFRDEFRPRFGVLRSREFIMKDSYSFHADEQTLDDTYNLMYKTYQRIFTRCGIPFVIVEAETGEMGGTGSHQFTVPCENGEDVIVYTEDSQYAANIEKAPVDAVEEQQRIENPPAIEEVHTPNVGSIEAVTAFLKTKPSDMIKTLIYSVEEDIVVVLIRGDHELNPEKLTQLVGGRRADLADEDTIEKVTGAKVGFAGPMGLSEKVSQVIIDHAVAAMGIGVTGANKTDAHVKNVVPGRDFVLTGENVTVADVRNAVEGDTYQGKKLLFRRGIEVGQVFKLGTKYTKKLGCNFLDENGSNNPVIMGTYGIGINRIVASAIETGNDENGILWPISIAPFEVVITALNMDDEDVAATAEKIYEELTSAGVDVLLDDRATRGGAKFKDADLLGIPVRVTIGKKALADGKVELKLRSEKDIQKTEVSQAVQAVLDKVASLKKEIEEKLATL